MDDLSSNNHGLDYLLELDGEIFLMDNGYWTKIEAKKVSSNEKVPHGIKYSLTLHDKNNTRVMGYDNAHGIKLDKAKFKANKTEWDHKHERSRVRTYEFKSAGDLLEDFWSDVNRVISGT